MCSLVVITAPWNVVSRRVLGKSLIGSSPLGVLEIPRVVCSGEA